MPQLFHLLNQYIKSTVINIYKLKKKILSNELKKIMRMMYHQKKNHKNLKYDKYQIGILDLNSFVLL